MTFKQFISKFHQEESGQDMLEYALVTAAVLAAVVAGSTTLSTMIKGEINTITTHIEAIALP
jgi:Flp pilus assembly pilin Flp